MSTRKSNPSFSTSLTAALLIALLQAAHTAPTSPKIGARATSVLKVGDLSFKDLNHNGVVDQYEDWRLPVERRVSDLVSKMTLEEKAGLMKIASLNSRSLDDYIN